MNDVDNKEQRFPHHQLDYLKRRHMGLIAQEVKCALPEAVYELGNYFGVQYESIVPLLVQAINDLNAYIDAPESDRSIEGGNSSSTGSSSRNMTAIEMQLSSLDSMLFELEQRDVEIREIVSRYD